MRELTNKQLIVLELLRSDGEMDCHSIARTLTERTTCAHCDGTGEGDNEHYGCRPCFGRGKRTMAYGEAYIVLKQLRARGLVARRCRRDEWGDELATHIYFAEPAPAADDPLEQAWQLPTADRSRAS